jgi:Zn-dependent protease with chaperone function
MTFGLAPDRPVVVARFNDGLVAHPQDVELRIGPDGFTLRGQTLQREYGWKGTRVSERLQHAPRMILFADGSFCEVFDHPALDAALAAAGYRESWVAHSLRRWSYVIGAVVLLLVAIWAGYLWGLPVAADLAARRIPPGVESGIGARARQIVEQQFEPSRLPQPQRDRVRRLFDSIAPRDGRSFDLVLRNGGPLGANAFALPGGTVVVTDQLVELAPEDPALAGVLAHEIGHIERRHVMRQIISGTVIGAVATLIAGDTSGLMVGLPATLANLSYSRQMEREADRYAVDLLKQKGIPIGAFADLLQRLQSSHRAGAAPDWARYLETHPDTEDRIAAIRAAAAHP